MADLQILLDAYEERGLFDTEDLRRWSEAPPPPSPRYFSGPSHAVLGCSSEGEPGGDGGVGGNGIWTNGDGVGAAYDGRWSPAKLERRPEVWWKH